jgi:pseudouridine-5'-phosphate glycosidase
MTAHHIDLHPQVRDALAERKPVVALESTIIAHGMPWPRNAETALQVQADVRAHGAVPATIAVIDGRPTVGLTDAQIERLGREGRAAAKLSRRDLAACMARGATGATTVAGTMVLAERAGIAVFATGGIGGVHRGAETSLDISADLHELARTPVAVVCAGAKSILDLPLTLEVLETLGVPVLGYRTGTLPAFFARDSGLALEQRFDDLCGVARAMRAHWSLGLGGLVVANPVPEAAALPREWIDRTIDDALTAAQAAGVRGKATTPFLLERIQVASQGRSLEANIALVRHNAAVAAQLAAAWASLP